MQMGYPLRGRHDVTWYAAPLLCPEDAVSRKLNEIASMQMVLNKIQRHV
jgi:hypothetical protein